MFANPIARCLLVALLSATSVTLSQSSLDDHDFVSSERQPQFVPLDAQAVVSGPSSAVRGQPGSGQTVPLPSHAWPMLPRHSNMQTHEDEYQNAPGGSTRRLGGERSTVPHLTSTVANTTTSGTDLATINAANLATILLVRNQNV